MAADLDALLRDWRYKPGEVVARLVQAADGREVLQMRLDLGVFQMEVEGRPDGERPHGFPTYFDYLKDAARGMQWEFVMSEEQCREADREFLQFYHRRICWLALHEYRRALADADHNLAFMDFVKRYAPSDHYRLAHEQYRGFVLFHRTQAAVAVALEDNRAEEAVEEVQRCRDTMRGFFEEYGVLDQFDEDALVQRLQELESEIRDRYEIRATLRERLDRAIRNEQYELAARLRDELRARQER